MARPAAARHHGVVRVFGGRSLVVILGLAVTALFLAAVATLGLGSGIGEGRCTNVTDVVHPGGSCLPVFDGSSVVSGDLRISVVPARPGRSEAVALGLRFTNTTAADRSLDWRRLSARSPAGVRVDCWGDDSSYRYDAHAGKEEEFYGGCDFEQLEHGTHRVFYDGVQAAAIDL